MKRILLLVLIACNKPTEPIRTHYNLVSIAGKPLPYQFSGESTIVRSGTFEFSSNYQMTFVYAARLDSVTMFSTSTTLTGEYNDSTILGAKYIRNDDSLVIFFPLLTYIYK